MVFQRLVDAELDASKERLDESLERWRILYRSAQAQLTSASQRLTVVLYPASSPDFKDAQLEQRSPNASLTCSANEMTGGQLSEFTSIAILRRKVFYPAIISAPAAPRATAR